MHLEISNFRGFQKSGRINIAPITILTGENSSGKTSFLAAVRYILDYMNIGAAPSFNKPPFLLGAYEQIAHYRGGKAGRASNFCFTIDDHAAPIERRRGASQSDSEAKAVKLTLQFSNKYSQPHLETVQFFVDTGTVTLNFTNDATEVGIERQPFSRQITIAREDFLYRAGEEDIAQSGVRIVDYALGSVRYGLKDSNDDSDTVKHLSYFSSYLEGFYYKYMNEIFCSAPVRSHPDRTYSPISTASSPEGIHVPHLLAKYRRYRAKEWTKIKFDLDKFGANSGLFNNISIKNLGKSESDPFQIFFDFGGPPRNIIDIGYGTSQVLPILTEVILAQSTTSFIFQQPEVHLHPQAQAALATFFLDQYKEYSHEFILETHSDYILDRVRSSVKAGEIKPSDVSILYFERKRLSNSVHQLSVDGRGNIIGAPPGYRRFFLDELRRSLQ